MSTSRSPYKNKKLQIRQEQNNFLQKVAELTPDLLTVIDSNTLDIVYVNNRSKKLLGLEPNYIYDKGSAIYETLLHPEDLKRCIQSIEDSKKMDEQEEIEVELRLKAASGEWNWFSFRTKVFKRGPDGAVAETISIAQNIQDQKIADEKLKEEHRRLVNAQAIGHIGNFELGLPGENMLCSLEFFKVLQLTPKEGKISLQKFISLVHPEEKEAFSVAIKDSLKSGKYLDDIHRFILLDGSIRHIHCRAEFIHNAQAITVQMEGTIQDVTEQVEAQQNIQHNEALIRRAEEVGSFGIYEFNLTNGNLWLSDGFYRLFGYAPQGFEPSIESIDRFSNPEDTEKVQKVLEVAKQNKKPYHYFRRIYLPNGELRHLSSNGNVICDEEGNAIKFLGIVSDITEQKKAEAELKEAKEFAEQIAAITPDHILIHEVYPKQKIVYSNHNHIWKDKFDDASFSGLKDTQRVDALVHQEDIEKAKIFVKERRLLVDGEVKEVVLHMNGKAEWVRIRSKVFRRDQTGQATHIISFTSDVTEKKKAEQELMKAYRANEQSKTTISRMLEGSLAGIMLLNPFRNEEGAITDFIIMGANKASEEISSKAEKELLGRLLLEVFPSIPSGIFGALLEVVQTGNIMRQEACLEMGDFNNWLYLSATRNNNGIILTFIDISDRKKAEEQLEENALFIQKVVNTTPDILFVYDQEQGQLQYINRNMFHLLGKDLENLQQMDMDKFLYRVHQEEREEAITYMRSFAGAEDKEVKEGQFRMQDIEGKWHWYHCRGRVFKRSTNGKVLQHLFIMRDITEEKNTTEALLEAEKLSIKGTMARTIAHEVRGPAANIALSVDIIRKELGDKLEENEEAMVFFDIITKSCNRVTSFINDLINIPTKQEDVFAQYDLAVLVQEVLKEAQDRIFIKGIKVERHYNMGHLIIANPQKLKIALLNIVINATEAMDDNEGILQVFILEEEKSTTISIQDNGIGMTEEQLSRMFEVYYTSKPNGLGVGLANVKAILNEHSAQIEVKSEAGKGTTFNVIFPKADTTTID